MKSKSLKAFVVAFFVAYSVYAYLTFPAILVREEKCESERYVILLGTGRSGSTTIATMLREAGIKMTGEHAGVIHELRNLDKQVETMYGHPNTQSWLRYRTMERNDRLAFYRRFLQELFCHTGEKDALCGFKEVRYLDDGIITFIRELFPCARVVLNYRRDVEAQIRSQQKLWDFSINATQSNEVFRRQAESHPDDTFLLATEDLNVQNMNSLLKWLGITTCEFTRMAQSNKGDNGYRQDTRRFCIITT
jgi:hypothetical protein